MKLKREKLLKAVTLATTAVSRRATLPVLVSHDAERTLAVIMPMRQD